MTQTDNNACSESEDLLRFQTLLIEISSHFINLPSDQIDQSIEFAQRRICAFFGLDRSTIWQQSIHEPDRYACTHVYQPDDVLPVIKPGNTSFPTKGEWIVQTYDDSPLNMQLDVKTFFPWIFEQVLQRGKTALISKLDDLPPEANYDVEMFKRFGTTSAVVIPLVAGGAVIGCITFAMMREVREWPQVMVKQLSFIAQVFANTLGRKMSEFELRASEARLSLATSATGVGLWILTLESGHVWCTPKTRELFHFAPDEELSYESFFKVIHPEDRERVNLAVHQALQPGENLLIEYRIMLPDGSIRWIAARGQLHPQSTGEPERIIGVSVDVTERKLTEQALEERLRFEQLLVNLSSRFVNIPFDRVDSEIESGLREILTFFQVDRCLLLRTFQDRISWQITHSVVSSNDVTQLPTGVKLSKSIFPWAYEKLSKKHEVMSISRLDELPAEASADRQSCIKLGIQSYLNIPILIRESVDVIHVSSAKSEREWPEEFFPRLQFLGEIFVNALERKRAEAEVTRTRAELAHVQRFLHLSELTASLSHELNQPLAAILSSAQAALRFLQSATPDLNLFRTILQNIIEDDKRAANVLRSVRSLVKGEEGEKKSLNINEVLWDILPVFQSEAILRNVEIKTDFENSLPPVLGDKVQLQQVLLNLIMNATEAMSQTQTEQKIIILRTHLTADNIQVVVRDFGPGIDPAMTSDIWQPFFTTKSAGLGIGLSVCTSIISAHGGRIRAENNPDGGATFLFELPVLITRNALTVSSKECRGE